MTDALPSVTRTELNQQTARVLARVEAGERLVITDRGRPIAELVPRSRSSWDELMSAGLITPARRSGPLRHPPVDAGGASSEELVRDMRRDRA